MKKIFFYLFLIIVILGAIFVYILYSEGAFETKQKASELKPFNMKCEAGKCGAGKCASAK
jgi:uncharacterized membrane protein